MLLVSYRRGCRASSLSPVTINTRVAREHGLLLGEHKAQSQDILERIQVKEHAEVAATARSLPGVSFVLLKM